MAINSKTEFCYKHIVKLSRNTPAKKKHQAIQWQEVTGFHRFQRQFQFSPQELIQMSTKVPFHLELE